MYSVTFQINCDYKHAANTFQCKDLDNIFVQVQFLLYNAHHILNISVT